MMTVVGPSLPSLNLGVGSWSRLAYGCWDRKMLFLSQTFLCKSRKNPFLPTWCHTWVQKVLLPPPLPKAASAVKMVKLPQYACSLAWENSSHYQSLGGEWGFSGGIKCTFRYLIMIFSFMGYILYIGRSINRYIYYVVCVICYQIESVSD
jgi:hypothetical protein